MHTYKVGLNWLSDRKGEIFSPELNSKIEVATPPQFPKGMEGIWSPEHLYTAAVNSCFMTTFYPLRKIRDFSFLNSVAMQKGSLNKWKEST